MSDRSTLRAFHGAPDIKTKYLGRVAEHRRLDQLQQRQTWDPDTQRGCAIGCTLHAYAYTAAWSKAKRSATKRQSEKLLELLAAAPVIAA